MLKASNIDENVAKKFIDLYLKSMDNHNVFKLYDKMTKIFQVAGKLDTRDKIRNTLK